MLCVTFAGAVGRSRRFRPLPSLFWRDWTKNGRQPFLWNTSSLSLRNLYGVLLFQRSAQTFPILGVTPSNGNSLQSLRAAEPGSFTTCGVTPNSRTVD